MSSLKDSWKKVGEDIEAIGKDLEQSIVQTVKSGAKTVSDWAEKEEKRTEAPKAEVVIDPEDKKE